MWNWPKQTKITVTVTALSLISLILALFSRSMPLSLTFLPHDVEWLLFLSVAMLLPLYRSQIFNEAFLKADIERLHEDVLHIKQHMRSGVFKFVGKANEVGQFIGEKILSAGEVFNTFIVYENPYTAKTSMSVKRAMVQFLREEKGLWEETVSPLGRRRVVEIEKELGQLPEYFKVRVIKEDKGSFPVCNFIVLRYPRSLDRSDEIFFGWGYFRGSSNENVFWSDDPSLVSFFLGYHKALRDSEVSDVYTPADDNSSNVRLNSEPKPRA